VVNRRFLLGILLPIGLEIARRSQPEQSPQRYWTVNAGLSSSYRIIPLQVPRPKQQDQLARYSDSSSRAPDKGVPRVSSQISNEILV